MVLQPQNQLFPKHLVILVLMKQLTTDYFSESDFILLNFSPWDKWLKKSVEVNEDELPVSQKTDKSSLYLSRYAKSASGIQNSRGVFLCNDGLT